MINEDQAQSPIHSTAPAEPQCLGLTLWVHPVPVRVPSATWMQSGSLQCDHAVGHRGHSQKQPLAVLSTFSERRGRAMAPASPPRERSFLCTPQCLGTQLLAALPSGTGQEHTNRRVPRNPSYAVD